MLRHITFLGAHRQRAVSKLGSACIKRCSSQLSGGKEIKSDGKSVDSKPEEAKSPDEKPEIKPSPQTQLATQKQAITRSVQRYGLHRYLHYVLGFERVLETKFPSAMHVYRVFIVGIKEFYKDIKHFVRVARIKNFQGFKNLSRKEIELYHQMPKDMLRVAPVLLLSALPFANYVIFPLAYMFPKQLLSSHFWSLQQRAEFSVKGLQRQLYNQRPVLRCMQGRLEDIEDEDLQRRWHHILGLLGSGVHPSVQEVLTVKQLFTGEPYHLKSLYSNHVNGLVRLHNLHIGWRRRSRLKDRALIVHEMDLAMQREGVESMSQDEIRWACFFRGLNPSNMKTEDMVEWLQDWATVSQAVDEESISLLLHCPVLLAYNHPTNWVLIYS